MINTIIGKIIVGIMAVAVVGGGIYVYNSNESQNKEISSVEVESNGNVTSSNQEEKKSIKDYFSSNGSYKCTISQDVQGVKSTGDIYIKNDMIHGEFNTAISGTNIMVHFVVKDGYSYMWNSMMPKVGYKTKANLTANNSTATNEMSAEYFLNQVKAGSYKCENWSGDNSKFNIPTNINFTIINQ